MKQFTIYIIGAKPIKAKGKSIEIKDGIAKIKRENWNIDYYKNWNNIQEINEWERFKDLP